MKNSMLITFFFSTIFCFSQHIDESDWMLDIEYLKTELPAKHIDFFSKQDKLIFENGLEEIKAQLKELSDFQIAIKLQELIAKFCDSHTRIKWDKYLKKESLIPMKALWFKDGIYVIKTTKNNNNLLGKKIIAINGITIAEIIDRLSVLITIDNEAIIRKSTPNLLRSIQLLNYYNIIKGDEIEFKIESNTGDLINELVVVEKMTEDNWISVELKSIPFYLQNERQYFWEHYIKEKGIYYIQYNKCLSKEVEQKYGNLEKAAKSPSFSKFENTIFSTINDNQVEKVIFDLRFNSGGNSEQGASFIKRLSKYKKINKKGKLYVIIGKWTYSSALLNAIDFKTLTNAIIVGEPTSGKPNHFGEVKSFYLPQSNLKVNYSTKYFKYVENESNTLNPDVKIELSFNDFISGVDPVYDWILEQQNNPSVPND